ncbi:MAG: class I mannose-6-phosphate isomerase [Cytophagales bacterium]|nr:class I mannose-6-phosphate isomerase [Cytophagales bacterium]
MTENLYPLKFKTIFKDKIWGGNKINAVLCKDFGDLPNCGETWEISGVEGDISIVADGALAGRSLVELIESYQGDLLGFKVYNKYGSQFPLLVKFIDANADLSIQVHPDDELAKARHNSFGKTEMWYVFQADEGSSLISGFNQPVDKEAFLDKFNSGRLMDILNREKVKAGDVFFIPAGRVHTIGKGLLLAEIQQTSDITYRIYDFDRVDSNGQKRELHVEEALDAIDYSFYDHYRVPYGDQKNTPVELVSCDYFTTNKITINQTLERDYSDLDSFIIYICFDGDLILDYAGGKVAVKKGDAVLLPAKLKRVKLIPTETCKILESYIDR